MPSCAGKQGAAALVTWPWAVLSEDNREKAKFWHGRRLAKEERMTEVDLHRANLIDERRRLIRIIPKPEAPTLGI